MDSFGFFAVVAVGSMIFGVILGASLVYPLKGYPRGYCSELIGANDLTVCEFILDPNLIDARLIAAAPCLLDALEYCVGIFEGYVNHHLAKGDHVKAKRNKAHAEKARAAIAKATGGE